jgi:Rieske Fe-S protein
MPKGKTYEYDGKTLTAIQWSRLLGISTQTIYSRLTRQRMTIYEALTKKVKKRNRITIDLGIRTGYVDTETNENFVVVRKQICSHFGCPKELSFMEKLFGNTCINHQ